MIKRIEYGEFGVISAIEFYDGTPTQDAIRIATALHNPQLSAEQVQIIVNRVLGKFVDDFIAN